MVSVTVSEHVAICNSDGGTGRLVHRKESSPASSICRFTWFCPSLPIPAHRKALIKDSNVPIKFPSDTSFLWEPFSEPQFYNGKYSGNHRCPSSPLTFYSSRVGDQDPENTLEQSVIMIHWAGGEDLFPFFIPRTSCRYFNSGNKE